MKKIVYVILACLLSLSATQAGKGKPKKVKMKTEVDTISYSMGIVYGSFLKKQLDMTIGDNYNKKLLLQGFGSYLKGDSSAIPLAKADSLVGEYLKAAFEEKQNKLAEDNKKYLVENAKKEGVTTTTSGLQYEVLVKGNGPKPADTSMVKVHYTGTLIDGTVFDSSYKRGEPASFMLNRVIKGWTEGVQLMSVGAKYRFVIPAELGYGSQKNQQIPANSTLVFDVELLEVESKQEEVKVNIPVKKEETKPVK